MSYSENCERFENQVPHHWGAAPLVRTAAATKNSELRLVFTYKEKS